MNIEHNPYILPQEQRQYLPNFLYYPAVFSHVECRNIVELGKRNNIEQSKLIDGQVASKHRNSSNSWIGNTQETFWIYQRLSEVLMDANSEFMYALSFFGEPLQFTRYDKGQFYNWHQDVDRGTLSIRKLSIVANVTDPRAYSGGELQIFSSIREKIPNDLGSVVIFPSFKEHRVTAVKEGTRHSLVSWVSGPPFR